jgi:O-antigen/teichoic acid export membrane protein
MLIGAVIFNVGLNFALIPRYSALGATIASVAAEVVLFVLTYFVIERSTRRAIRWSLVIRPLAATLLLAPLLILTRTWSLLITLPATIGLFVLLLFVMKAFSQEETRALVHITGRLRFIPPRMRARLAAFMTRRAGAQAPAAAEALEEEGDYEPAP